jgi:CheY-like chemotaxis protein
MFQAITKFPHLRVLAIEDHLPNIELLESMLLDFSCDFEIVDNRHQALDLHINNPFDIIVMDILAPGIDGQKAINRIKSLPGHAGAAHVIALVTSDQQKNILKWLNQGVSHHIEKPLKINDLEQAFLRLVPGKARKSF